MKNAQQYFSAIVLIGLMSMILLYSCNNTGLSPYEKEIKSHRTAYLESFLGEDRSPLNQEDLQYLSFFKADSTFRVTADFEMLVNEAPFDIPTSSGNTKSYRKFAKLTFSIMDSLHTLFAYQSMKLLESDEYRDYLFLPFTDLTNGTETYGGGRYLDLSTKDFDASRVIIDFNKSYNPWCAYSDGFNCPIPPADNDLSIPILAGEMKYLGAYKHQAE